MNIALYAQDQRTGEYNRLDLFQDENINFVSKATDLNQLDKVFSDFTQSFTVPTSRLNNYTFQHWYNTDIDGNLNPNIRIPAFIEIGTLPFRSGKLQLEEILTEEKEPKAYRVTFYGDLVSLKDLFGEDKMNELGRLSTSTGATTGLYNDNPVLNFFDHDFSPANVKQGLTGSTFMNNDMIYPLISPVRTWQINTGVKTQPDTDPPLVMDITRNDGAIGYYELKPSIRVLKLIEAIEYKYGIQFTRDFLGTATFRDIFMWLTKNEGYMQAFGEEKQVDFTSQAGQVNEASFTVDYTNNILSLTPPNYNPNRTYGYYVTMRVIPQAGFENVPFNMRYNINNITTGANGDVKKDNVTGIQEIQRVVIDGSIAAAGQQPSTYQYKFFVSSTENFSYNVEIVTKKAVIMGLQGDNFNGVVYGAADSSAGKVKVVEQLTDMKVIDFIGYIVKMFNLIIRPVNTNLFSIRTLNDFYAGGDIIEATDYVDISDIKIERTQLYKTINYKFNKTENILGKNFRDTYGGANEVGYGDLRAQYPIDSSKDELKIEVGFDNMLFDRLIKQNVTGTGNTSTSVYVGTAVTKDLKPNNSKPVLFYNNGIMTLRSDEAAIKFKTLVGVDDIRRYNIVANENDLTQEQITNALNFGSESSPYTYEIVRNSLYNNFWDNYISNIYNQDQRKYKMRAILPINITQKLTLDDRLNINDRQYRIESIETNLLDGECNMVLINNFYDAPFTVTNQGIDRTFVLTSAGQKYFDVTIDTDSSWSITSFPSWVVASQSSGFGKTVITLRVLPITSGTADRNGNVVITTNGSNYTFNIIQVYNYNVG